MKRLMTVALLALLAPLPTVAQEYPSKPVRLIVPNAVGGATDAAARLYQTALEGILPQPIVVVNLPGAGTATGSRQVKNAAPDGYNILLIHQALFTSSVMGLTDYGPDAFQPVAMTGVEPTTVVVRGDSPYKTLDEFYAAARNAPGTIKAGVQIGALNHFAMAMVASAGDVQLNYVQTGGGGPTYAALLGGHIEAAYGSVPDVLQYIQAGEMRALATLGDERADDLPEVPTAAEQGFDVELPIRHVWYMPAGTPAEPVAMIEDALTKAIETDVVKEFYGARSIDPVIVTGHELKAQIADEYATFQTIESNMSR